MNRAEFQWRWQQLHKPRLRPSPEQLPIPTEAQLDLLKAAVMPAEIAAPAWRRWKDRGLHLETADEDSIRMFSQLWTNREAAGIDPEDLPLLKGFYRHVLAGNAVKLAKAVDDIQVLTDAGIPVLLIKGAAMIAGTGQLGLRRIVDVDVLVPELDARRAVDLLKAAGYSDKDRPAAIGKAHSWSGRNPADSELDVHWWAFKTAGDDLCMFDTARPAFILSKPVLIPSATESLIIAIANAFRSHPAAPMRWVADAMWTFQNEAELIDWDVVLRRAERPGLKLGLTAGLDFLVREFAAPVPPEVLTDLRRRPVHWRERAAHWAALKDRPTGTYLANELLGNRARWLNYPTVVSRRGYLVGDVRIVAKRTARAVLGGLVRSFDAASARMRAEAQSTRQRRSERAPSVPAGS
jgi:hypothetical protein